MLSGFNTNVRHRGVVFHVQTEDSGRAHPHVITHLFHGGNILASEKQSYEHLLQEEGPIEPQVKQLMEALHTTMVDKLSTGALDAVIRERLGIGSADEATDGGAAPAAPKAPTDPKPRARAPAPEETPPAPVATNPEPAAPSNQRPLDEVVLDYLLESARQRSKR